MKLKKLIIFGLSLGMTLFMIGCSSSSDENTSESNKLEEIKNRGKLIVATSADYPPYEFHKIIDGKDTIVGLDAMIDKDIADGIGVELEFLDMDFDGVLGAVNADKADLVLAGMTATDERKESVNFSEPYYHEKNKIIVRKGDEDIAKTEDNVKNMKMGVQKGSIQETFIAETLGSINYKSLAKIPDLILELQNGNIDGILCSENVTNINIDSYEGISVANSTVGEDIHKGASVAFKKDDSTKELVEVVNKILKGLNESGTIDKYMEGARNLAKEE
ncbi:transporter substrate-binding domain-containing protein [Romboutsia sp. 1001713B170207_170306_H8]|uniref:transporter substrate-binding domain-containing protein n=1 Tax=Romboutsia sp. 1001713B170207_170306_H8 TaxID=2787112 RepID=UPI00189B5AA0|nr:transporter substrate-binding domain-containing protein [Romboutsia sp. 1001713B170207_170306_H8]